MKYHVCTKCHEKFGITAGVRVWNSPGYLVNPFHGPLTQLKLFSFVRCPHCNNEEYDPSIKFMGIFSPVAIWWLLGLFLLIAVLSSVFSF